jgi:TonB family protein
MSTLAEQPMVGHGGVIDWVLPGKPLHVELSGITLLGIQLSVKQRLQRQPHLRPGGLLLGNCIRSRGWTITVERHLPLEWDVSRGGAPFLTDGQRQNLHTTLVASFTEAKIVGVYRAASAAQHTVRAGDPAGDGVLTDDDRHLMESCTLFPIALGICLEGDNLEPFGFAFWEDGNVYELAPAPPDVARDSHAKPAFVAIRDQPLVAPKPPHAKDPTSIRSKPAPLESKPHRKAYLKRVWPLPRIVLTIGISVLAVVAVYVGLKPLLQHIGPQKNAGPAGASETALRSTRLGLKITPSGPALDVSWDPSSPVIRSARSGKLLVGDGRLNAIIDVNRDQLRTGRIIYDGPASGDVTFRLEVTDSASHSLEQSVRISGEALTRASLPPNEDPVPVSQDVSHVPRRHESTPTVLIKQSSATALPSPEKQADPQFAKASRQELPHEPRISQPQSLTTSMHPALPSDSQVRSRKAAEGKKLLTPAKALTFYFPNAWQDPDTALEKDVFVWVIVEINEAGDVSSAALTRADPNLSPYLANQAINAARRWRFSPATVNGRPVGSQQEIRFHFSPQH